MKKIKASIIVPCKNESSHIAQFLDSIIAQDYPKDNIEMLISDGKSIDNTKAIINEYAKKYSWIKCIHNEKEITPAGLNLAIKQSSGEFIIRLDVHSFYPSDYVRKCLTYIQSSESANIGGRWIIKPQKNTPLGQVIAFVLSHPFGAGSAHYRLAPKAPIQVDTVPFGCFKRFVFDEIGLFDERYIRNQDYELNKRIIESGKTITLYPNLYCTYFCRSNYSEFAKHCYKNGYWITFPLKYSLKSLTFRHLIPLFFAISVLTYPVGFFISYLSIFLMASFTTYTFITLLIGLKQTIQTKKTYYLILPPIVFFTLHFFFGLGSLVGFFSIFKQTHSTK